MVIILSLWTMQKRAVNWIWLTFVLTNLLFLKKKKASFVFKFSGLCLG